MAAEPAFIVRLFPDFLEIEGNGVPGKVLGEVRGLQDSLRGGMSQNPVHRPPRGLQGIKSPSVFLLRGDLPPPPGLSRRPPVPVQAPGAAEDEARPPFQGVDVPPLQVENAGGGHPHRSAEPLFLRQGIQQGKIFVVAVQEEGGPWPRAQPFQLFPFRLRRRVAPEKAEITEDHHQVIPGKPLPGGKISRREAGHPVHSVSIPGQVDHGLPPSARPFPFSAEA